MEGLGVGNDPSGFVVKGFVDQLACSQSWGILQEWNGKKLKGCY